ncbi:MAG: phosphatase PAP2 family protein [Candidatus Nezhaarchaeota archaeon]|nr:phosphatase PAP2 family protein [Candidatus Nezhaarchaeota archaeon]
MRRSTRVILMIVLCTLVFTLAMSLMVNSVNLWIAWTRLGDEELYVAAVVVLYFLLPQIHQGLVLALAILLSGSLNITLKYAFNMPRPPDPLIDVSGPSFPSGHAQISSSFWSALSFIAMNKLIAAISATVVVGISMSRVLLRAHYEMDVVGGALLGLAIGYTSYCSLAYYLKRRSDVLYYVFAGIAMAMSACNAAIFNAELSSSMTILGLSSAILTMLPVTKGRLARPSSSSMIARIVMSLVSVVLLWSVHLVTKSFDPLVRLACLYALGLYVFTMPLTLSLIAHKRFK